MIKAPQARLTQLIPGMNILGSNDGKTAQKGLDSVIHFVDTNQDIIVEILRVN